jgi:hypothetical protein
MQWVVRSAYIDAVLVMTLVAWLARRAGPLLSSGVRQFQFLAICTLVVVAVLQELIY